MNCWEYFYCDKITACPAYPDHGTHCALVQSTVCYIDTVQKVTTKFKMCIRCGFYKSMHYDHVYRKFGLKHIE